MESSDTTSDLVTLDGRTLEGGGQLLRLALSLSCLTGRGIYVTDIRGNRAKSRGRKAGQAGGMKTSHLECARWLARAACAHTKGMELGSPELIFQPRLDQAIDIDSVLDDAAREVADVGKKGKPSNTGIFSESQGPAEGVDKDTSNKAGSRAPRRLTITQKTPGAVYLILQALLPYLLFGPLSIPRPGEDEAPKILLRVIGGTNVSSSPSHEYVTQVLFPMLEEHLGIPPIKTKLITRGWSSPPEGPGRGGGAIQLGEVVFEITPMPLSKPLPAFKLKRQKEHQLEGLDLYVLAHPKQLLHDVEDEIRAELEHRYPDTPVQTSLKEDSGRRNRVYALVVARVGDGKKTYRLGCDSLHDGSDKAGADFARRTAKKLVAQIREEVSSGALVDQHLQDQLVVFQALAEGRSEVDRGKAETSLHTLTARWVAEQMLGGLKFADDGACDGKAFVPGAQFSKPKSSDARIAA